MRKYEIWYTPRIHDEVPMWGFETLKQAKEQMAYVKKQKPKGYPHYYIWNIKKEKKVKI
tara:strand:+ start:201 stop:377 length:177 start_codon:yes stop_codon:yes gene_type:complete